MQYSDALSIIPVSKLPPVGPEIGLDEPTLKGDEGESTTDEDKEPTGDEDKKPTTDEDNEPEPPKATIEEDNETASTVPPNRVLPTEPKLGLTTNLSQPYKIKITFNGIKLNFINAGQSCAYLDIGVYVQGKLINLDDGSQLFLVCNNTIKPLTNKEVTVDIPAESVESPKDYQALSIFTVGSHLSRCDPKPVPEDLPVVRKILSDKGSTRPYYEHAKENIEKIKEQISNGCIPKTTDVYGCISAVCGTFPFYSNTSLATINILEASPGYGKVLPKDSTGNPPSVQINTCEKYRSDFCLYYTLDCPLCPAVPVHK